MSSKYPSPGKEYHGTSTINKGLYISNPDKYIGEILALNRV